MKMVIIGFFTCFFLVIVRIRTNFCIHVLLVILILFLLLNLSISSLISIIWHNLLILLAVINLLLFVHNLRSIISIL